MTESDPTARARPPRGLLAALALVVLGVPFLGAEIYTRVRHDPIDLWALTGRAAGANPMADWAVVDAFAAFRAVPGRYGPGKTVNRHGFISTPELDVEKPEDVLRIVFLGASSTAGTGHDLADEETWPWKTVELLRDRAPPGTRIEFINGALGGYTTFESYGRLWSRIRFFEPDIIVVDHGWNEMYYFDRVDSIHEWRVRPDGSWSIETTAEPVAWHRPLPIDHLARHSQLLTRLRLLHLPTPNSGEVAPTDTLRSGYDHRGIEVFRSNLRLLRETARALGVELFVVKQPTLIVPGLPEKDRDRARYEYHGFDHATHVEAYRALYEGIDREIAAGNVIDATPMSGDPDAFFDHVHPTPAGARRLAGIVADALTPMIAGPSN
ncbi:MAG: GDSL-type esterase/lipase family protein [Longimicrobiales bacterium]|nr:GDSL-type esterase/lipase family protein [Longimicrobiales bacterium]